MRRTETLTGILELPRRHHLVNNDWPFKLRSQLSPQEAYTQAPYWKRKAAMHAGLCFSFSVEMSSRIWIANDFVAQNACPILTSHMVNVAEQEIKGTQVCQHGSLEPTSSFPLSYKCPLPPGHWRKPPSSVPTCVGNFTWAPTVAANTLATWTCTSQAQGEMCWIEWLQSQGVIFMTSFLTLNQGTCFLFNTMK